MNRRSLLALFGLAPVASCMPAAVPAAPRMRLAMGAATIDLSGLSGRLESVPRPEVVRRLQGEIDSSLDVVKSRIREAERLLGEDPTFTDGDGI